jgi:hypothetical protein
LSLLVGAAGSCVCLRHDLNKGGLDTMGLLNWLFGKRQTPRESDNNGTRHATFRDAQAF